MIIDSVTGVNGVLRALEDATIFLKERADASVQEAAQYCLAEAQDTSPVETGEMRDGFTYVKDEEMSAIVYNDVPHSLFVELGTVYMEAEPTLYPAFADACEYLMKELGGRLL